MADPYEIATALLPLVSDETKARAESDLECGEPLYAIVMLLSGTRQRIPVARTELTQLRDVLPTTHLAVAAINDALAIA